jgi:hypothetical protein
MSVLFFTQATKVQARLCYPPGMRACLAFLAFFNFLPVDFGHLLSQIVQFVRVLILDYDYDVYSQLYLLQYCISSWLYD